MLHPGRRKRPRLSAADRHTDTNAAPARKPANPSVPRCHEIISSGNIADRGCCGQHRRQRLETPPCGLSDVSLALPDTAEKMAPPESPPRALRARRTAPACASAVRLQPANSSLGRRGSDPVGPRCAGPALADDCVQGEMASGNGALEVRRLLAPAAQLTAGCRSAVQYRESSQARESTKSTALQRWALS